MADDFYPQCLLAFDEFQVKEIDQDITFPRVQRVLPQLNDRTAALHLFQTFADWFSHDSSSSPRFSRGPLKPGFSQINITLDSAQGLVIDGLFVAQLDHGVAFCL